MGSVSSELPVGGQEYPGWVRFWFLLDAVFALLPPLYWAAGGPGPAVFGLPVSVLYFLLVGASITGSILAAYMTEAKRGHFQGAATYLPAEDGK